MLRRCQLWTILVHKRTLAVMGTGGTLFDCVLASTEYSTEPTSTYVNPKCQTHSHRHVATICTTQGISRAGSRHGGLACGEPDYCTSIQSDSLVIDDSSEDTWCSTRLSLLDKLFRGFKFALF
ncbi:hypothetical protein BJY52DRAFT_941308 [Lactarius psammicola]|nr:hypothetical protein BJY52DRAFT_941308 [Lactarius psammicola]